MQQVRRHSKGQAMQDKNPNSASHTNQHQPLKKKNQKEETKKIYNIPIYSKIRDKIIYIKKQGTEQ